MRTFAITIIVILAVAVLVCKAVEYDAAFVPKPIPTCEKCGEPEVYHRKHIAGLGGRRCR